MTRKTRLMLLGLGIIFIVSASLFALYLVSERRTGTLKLLFEKDPLLFNPYGVILVNPEKHQDVKFQAAAEFAKWLISEEGQNAIASYKLNGAQLFTPNFNESLLDSSERAFWDGITVGESGSETIVLATTTSTRDSGLLDYLLPKFYKVSKVRVDVVAKGTGLALEMARAGDADLVMVHARSLEDEFVAAGDGVHRVDLMYNDFVIVGPSNDPAEINQTTSVVQAFIKIYKQRALFISRGDNSGTNVKELYIWNQTGLEFRPDDEEWRRENTWYIETGQGMGNTLTITLEKLGYTITDRATWLTFKENAL